MRVLILGGSGRQAKSIVMGLLEIDPDDVSEITLGARRPEALETRVKELENPKIRGEVINIDDRDALVKLMKKHDLVMHAASSPTVYPAVQAALEAGVNIVTLIGLEEQQFTVSDGSSDEFGFVKEEFLSEMDKRFKQAGIIGVMGMGYVPGTTNFLGKYFGDKFETIESMTWYYASARLGEKLFFSETPRETIWLYHQPGLVFKEGKYVRVLPQSSREVVQFPEPIGETEVQHMPFMGVIPVFAKRYKSKGIKDMDLKLGYWSGYLSKMDFLASVGLLDLEPRKVGEVNIIPADVFLSGPGIAEPKEGAKLLDWGCVRLVIEGEISGKKVKYIADVLQRPYRNLGGMQLLTGIPAAIGIHMVARGDITQKGCYSVTDDAVDAEIFFKELSRRECQISYTYTEMLY